MQLRNGSTEKLYFNIFCRAIQALQNGAWESVGANDFVPLFPRGTIFYVCADSMQNRGYHRAHGRLRVIKLERIDSGRVALPV